MRPRRDPDAVPPLTCPECGKTLPLPANLALPSFPFCSGRCQLLDFGRWLRGEFSLSGRVDPDLDPEEGPPGARP